MSFYKILLLLFFFILIFLTIYNIIIYNWCNKNIYNYHEKLNKSERLYIYICLLLSSSEIFKFIRCNKFISQLSFYSFSSEFKNKKMNSSRLAFGSTVLPEILYIFYKNVLKERGIDLIQDNNLKFYGLGWDFENNIFKIYYRYFDIYKIDKSIQTVKKYNSKKYNKQGLLSYSYDIYTNKLVETKLYFYPLKNKNIAYLYSDKRNEKQVVVTNKEYYNKINKKGKDLIDKYNSFGIKLDTVNYRNKNNYVLYFPL